ncbi:MAG: rhomboid family intramembrane serine protease [Gammaproteobacteria bacterium]|nr:MAG: rhomboid family intramembrane serine protease [Gammaproteobacteria bacterium]
MTNNHDMSQQAIRLFIQQLYQNCPRVLITPVIFGLNIAVFIFMLLEGVGVMGDSMDLYIRYGANFGPLTKDDQWWRLLTSMFLHFGILHLVFNMWALWDAGRLTERLYGNFHFLWIYIFSGLFGSLSSLYWNNDDVVSVGASGAVFGVFGALMAYLVVQKYSVPVQLLRRLMNSAIFFIGFSLFYGFTKSGIDNAAHVGGMLSGFILGVLLAKPLGERTRYSFKMALAFLGSVVICFFAIQFASPPAYNYQAQKEADTSIRSFISREKALVAELRQTMETLRNANMIVVPDITAQLETNIAGWRKLEGNMQVVPSGIRTQTADMIDLLREYAGYRAQSAYYLKDFLETNDPESQRLFIDVRKKTEDLLNKLNNSNKK